MVTRPPGGNKKRSLLQRDVLGELQMNNARTVELSGDLPVARVYGQSKIVVPNANYDPNAVPKPSFAGTGPHILKGRRLTTRFVLPEDWKDGDSTN